MTAEHVFGVTVAGDSSCDKCCCQSCHSLFATRRVCAQLWRRCAAATPEPASDPCHHAPLRAMQMKAAAFQFLHAAQQPCILHVMLHVAGREEAAHRPVHVLCWLRSKH